jgi:hypothetical protein
LFPEKPCTISNVKIMVSLWIFVSGFRETLRSDIDVGRFQRPEASSKNMNLVIVSHGLTLRVFLMRWYKWTVEQFEGLWNFGNTGMLVMELGPGGRCASPCTPSLLFFFFSSYKMYFFLPMVDYDAFNKFYGN